MMRMNNLFVIGDFNARIGTQLSGIVGPHLLATSNSDNGEKLITVCQYPQYEHHKYHVCP